MDVSASGVGRHGVPLLDGHIVAFGIVEHLAGEEATPDFAHQQSLLLLDLLEHALVLLGATGQVRQHLLHGSVGYILVCRVARLAYSFFLFFF